MAAVTFKCPNCGGDLKFDPDTQRYQCEYCMSDFGQSELETANPQAFQEEAPEDQAEGHKREGTESDTKSESDEWEGTGAKEQGALVYSCPSCGAQIVTDATTAATFCYYCHNPVVLKGNLSGEYRPDLVIPFAISRKKAEESFLNYVKRKKFVPRDFFCKEQIEKISGIYFPFWTYSCTAEGEWHGQGNKIRIYRRGDTEVTETRVFDVEREGELEFQNLTRNALNKENKQLVEAVQPFKLEEARAFSMGYLSGFQAEKRDMEKSEFLKELNGEVQKHGSEMMRSSVNGYDTVHTSGQHIRICGESWKYLLLPVWVLTYKGGNGKTYYYAMNGQNGKISGVLPLDWKKVIALFFSVFLPLMILLLIGGYLL